MDNTGFVVLPVWNAVKPMLTVAASGGAVTSVSVGAQAGLGFDPYGTQVPLAFSGSCTAQAVGNVNSGGAIGSVTVTSGGVGCSNTTTASVNVAGTWDTDAAVNLISGQSISFYGGNLLKGNGGYTVWNATYSTSNGTQLDGGGGNYRAGEVIPLLWQTARWAAHLPSINLPAPTLEPSYKPASIRSVRVTAEHAMPAILPELCDGIEPDNCDRKRH